MFNELYFSYKNNDFHCIMSVKCGLTIVFKWQRRKNGATKKSETNYDANEKAIQKPKKRIINNNYQNHIMGT